jgi:hypothetical protein
VEYALGSPGPDPEWKRSIEEHLGTCDECAADVELMRRGETELAGRSGAGSGVRASIWIGLAAGLFLVVVGYSLHLQFQRIPAFADGIRRLSEETGTLRSELAEIRGGLEETYGPYRVDPLPGVLLGGEGEGIEIPVHEGQIAVDIVPDPVLPRGFRDEADFLFEIRDARGTAVWRHAMTAPDIERYMAPPGALAFRIPLRVLPDNEYTMVLIRRDGEKEETLFEKPFRFVR